MPWQELKQLGNASPRAGGLIEGGDHLLAERPPISVRTRNCNGARLWAPCLQTAAC